MNSITNQTHQSASSNPSSEGGNLLVDHLRRVIGTTGPMTVGDYMSTALHHPQYGYYRRKSAVGLDGDFTTAPEISQIFGELIGVWCYQAWLQLGRPTPFQLVELGPGRGTLMADIVRCTDRWPEFKRARAIRLVEVNETLRDKQREVLGSASVSWSDTFQSVPEGPFILIANEFFDCLPIRQFVRVEGGWREKLIGLSQSGDLTFTMSEMIPAIDLLLPPGADSVQVGTLFEICPPAVHLCRDIAERACKYSGAALIIDYGFTNNHGGDTFQAVKSHQYADPLGDPGETDLTAHVDFSGLVREAELTGANVSGPITQDAFLNALGIGARAERLMTVASHSQKDDIRSAVRRLTGEDEMGTLFKVMAITHNQLGPVAGFVS